MDYRACIFKLVYHSIKIFCFKMVEAMAKLVSSVSMCLLPHFLNSEVGSLDRGSVSCTIILVAKK